MQFILDAAARPRHGASPQDREQARLEAERVQKPWLERNLPVTPPPHVAASAVASPPKAAAYTAEDFASSGTSDHRQETRQLDVLSFKVGYSQDAEYALPDEVRPSLSRPHSMSQRRVSQPRCCSVPALLTCLGTCRAQKLMGTSTLHCNLQYQHCLIATHAQHRSCQQVCARRLKPSCWTRPRSVYMGWTRIKSHRSLQTSGAFASQSHTRDQAFVLLAKASS